jgi:hypothetical protein
LLLKHVYGSLPAIYSGLLTGRRQPREQQAKKEIVLPTYLGRVFMPDKKTDFPSPSQQRERALSRWDNEGGAGPSGPQSGAAAGSAQQEVLELTNAELVQLLVRTIALENLVIALLAEASGRQIDLVREMAAYISPRPGFTQHPLTVHAAAHMVDLVERANHFRVARPS